MLTNKDIKFFLKDKFDLDIENSKYNISLDDMLGSTLSKGVKLYKIDEKTLYLKTISPIYKTKLEVKKRTLLKKINKYYPQLNIKDIITYIVTTEKF